MIGRALEIVKRAAGMMAVPDSARMHALFYDVGLWVVFVSAVVLGYSVPFILPVGHVAILFLWGIALDEEDRPAAKSRIELAGYLFTLIFVSFVVAKVAPGDVGEALRLAFVTSFVGWWGGQKLAASSPDEIEGQFSRLHESLEALNASLATLRASLQELDDSRALEALKGIRELADRIEKLSASVQNFDSSLEEASAMALEMFRKVLERIRKLH